MDGIEENTPLKESIRSPYEVERDSTILDQAVLGPAKYGCRPGVFSASCM
ncbi:MAG: hypothetical protein WC375_01230 [Methanomassiliicoccales archaeon]